MAKRRLTRKQARYFAPRRARARRSNSRVIATRRRSGGSRMGGGWLPTPMQSSIVNFASGASMPFVNGFIAPYTDGILSPLGSYKDEARTAIVGIAAYKLGSGIIKQAGKAYFDYAVTSAGVQTGMIFTGTNNTGGSGFSTGNSQGVFSW